MEEHIKIDPEIKSLIQELNKLDFLKTEFSCSGHDGDPYISFKILDLKNGFNFLYDLLEHIQKIWSS